MITNVSSIIPFHAIAAPATNPASMPSQPVGATGEDIIELSPLGRALAQAASQSTLRIAQIHAIRSEIEAGTYETSARINGTAERLLNILA